MTYSGRVKNGVGEEGADLPEGTSVRVEPVEERPLMDLLRAVENAPPNPDWPSDGAAQVAHYLYGTPKQEP